MMTEQQHSAVVRRINAHRECHGVYPSHETILRWMLETGAEITYRDALEYGLGSTFRSRLSDLRHQLDIESREVIVPTRYGRPATVHAHRLARGGVQ
ncbi:hypothetical protein KRX19_05695 [Cardiobacteriaceae bacterium TAE3-ERU3]|nr:hypothetical protein [Cardiobacteriaceae bacterium TAE3-ERU3]